VICVKIDVSIDGQCSLTNIPVRNLWYWCAM